MLINCRNQSPLAHRIRPGEQVTGLPVFSPLEDQMAESRSCSSLIATISPTTPASPNTSVPRARLHQGDGAARLGIERVITGDSPVRLDEDLTLIPTPGHTRGHQVLLYRDQALFTGDHLSWSPGRQMLIAHRNYCWDSWPTQTRSMEHLLDYQFQWVLPGHGRIGHASAQEMHRRLQDCIAWIKTV